MSDLSNPSVITPSTLENGTDKGSAITMASSLGVQPRPEDSQGLQVEPLADVVDTKNTALGCTPISMLATAASSDMLGLGADKREASAVLEGEVSSDFKSRDEHLAVRPSFAGKASHKLQLPSFENLGIASPHPDYVCPRRHIFDPFNPLPHHTGLGIRRFPNISNHDHLRPIQGSSYLLTPPDDSGTINWKTSARTFTDNSQKVPSSGSETMAAHQGVPMVNATNSDGGRSGPSSSPPDDRRGDATMGGGCGQTVPPTADGDNSGGHSLLEEAIGITVSGISSSVNGSYAVRVLSHALPCPSADNTISSVTTFTSIITAIQAELHSSQNQYINVTHAVPSKFCLTDLPSSPPGTPIPHQGGEDYFNMTVFANAVPVIDHHDMSKGMMNSPAPSSPCPIVPPASVHVALVERFIPPGSVQEYLDLCSPTGPSVLVDRLSELSPDGGSMLFIYPTRQGADTFVTEYLGPILDPLLRSIVVLHELSADVGIALGKMAAVEHMVGFETMKRKISILLRRLHRDITTQGSGSSTSSHKGSYNLVFSGTQEVRLERKVWTDWWARQENARIRDVMARYFKRAQRLPRDTEITSPVLAREIIDEVSSRPYGDPPAPSKGVEMGVFVIQRIA